MLIRDLQAPSDDDTIAYYGSLFHLVSRCRGLFALRGRCRLRLPARVRPSAAGLRSGQFIYAHEPMCYASFVAAKRLARYRLLRHYASYFRLRFGESAGAI